VSTLWYDSFLGGNLVGEGSPFLPDAYNELSVGSYTFYAECVVGGCISERTPVTLSITEGAPAPIVPDAEACNGDTIKICFSIANDPGISTDSIFVSPPNSSSTSSLIPVDEEGCVTIASGDEGYVSGTYTVTYVDANGCLSAPGEGTITIHDNPNPPVIKTECVCEGEDAQLTIANPVQGGTYTWYDPAGEYFSDNVNPTVFDATLMDAGIYSVTVTDPNGCTAVEDADVCINPNPTVAPSVDYTLATDCSLSDIMLMSNANDTDDNYTYSWVGPNGFTSTLADPTIANATTDANGTYTVTVTSVFGCVATGATEVTTVENPENLPIIASEPGPVCEGECMTLSTTAYEGSSVNYVWFTPDGTLVNITGENTNELNICPTEAGVHEGAYQVGVTIDGCELISDVYNLDVLEQPIVSIDTNPVCEGGDVMIDLTVDNADDLSGELSYEWSGPNGFSSNAEDVTIANATSANEGTYTVTVSTLTSCATTISIDVELFETLPAASISRPEGEFVCRDESFTLCTSTAADYPDATFTFSPPNSTSGASGIVADDNGCITVTSLDLAAYVSGDWTVSYVDANGCESEEGVPFTITLVTPPPATADNNGPICYGDDVQLFAGIVEGATYEWYTEDNPFTPFSTEQNPVVTNLTEKTTFIVYVTVDGCTSFNFTTVILEGPIVIATENTPVCTGEDIVLTAEIENEGDFTGFISYEWSGPNGFTSTAQNPVISNASLADAGTYTVFVTTSGEASVEVEVYEVLPAASIDGPEIVCEGDAFTLCTSSYEDYPNGTFTISPPNSTSTSSALEVDDMGCVTITPDMDAYVSGAFTVQYTNEEGCESAPGIPFEVSINPIPVVTATNNGAICEGEDVQLFANSADGATYEWYTGDELVSTEQNPIIYGLEQTTTYSVTATVDGCISAPAVTTVIVHPIPEIITVLGGGTYCEGTDVTLASIVEDAGPGSTYTWIGPNGFEFSSIIGGNVTLPAVTEADAGVYTLVVTSAEGCVSEPYSVTIDVIGQIEPIILSSDSGCEGGEITISIAGYEGTDVTYEWTTPNGTTDNISGLNTNEIMIDPASAATHNGEYTVTVIVNGCSLTSDPYYLDINESPAIQL